MTAADISPAKNGSEQIKLGSRMACVLAEWSSTTIPNVQLSNSDRELVKRIGDSGKGRLYVDELRDGLRIQTRSWVGVVRLESIEIRIVPKLAGGRKSIARLLEFTSGLEGLGRFDADAVLKVEGTALLDLVALLFVEATERVVRRGLVSGYIEHEEDLPVVRGRILADRQILKRFGRLDRIICRFDELEHDVDENRLLLLALRVAARRISDRGVHRRFERLRSLFEPICDPMKLNPHVLNKKTKYNRLNAHYERAHWLARFLLDGLGVDDVLAHGRTQSFAFLLDMNLLFERFVERLFLKVLDAREFQIKRQPAHRSVIQNVRTQKHYSRVVPDLLIHRRNSMHQRLLVDAKYKLYDEKHLAASDIYQAFIYAFALSPSQGDSAEGIQGAPTALLIYPSSGAEEKDLLLEVKPIGSSSAARVHAIGIPIASALEEITTNQAGPVLSRLESFVTKLLPPLEAPRNVQLV